MHDHEHGQTNEVIEVSGAAYGNQGLMKDNLIVQKDQGAQLIENLFKEDEDLKLKLASQYDMLSYVGSEIDEVKMDHLTFFKIFHQLPSIEDAIRFDHVVELDTKQQALLKPIGLGEDNLLTAQSLQNNTFVIKTLAFAEQLRQDLHEVIIESKR